jgi:uncharacterized protein
MNGAFAEYLPYIRARWLREQQDWQNRRERAWESARRAATVLRDQFGARRVIAFGSLVRSGPFDDRSDVDLAIEGVPPGQFFRAGAAAAAVCHLELDIVDLADCSPRLREAILSEGVPL